MIIDVHYHLIPILPEEMIEGLIRDPMRAAAIIGKKITKDQIFKMAAQDYQDPEGEKLLKSMEEAGVDFTVVCAVDNAGNPDITAELVQAQNQIVGGIARRHPDRLMALAGVDPRRPQGPDMLKQCFEEFGMKGLKYHPDWGFDPISPESYTLLEYLEANKGILLTHTGPMYPPSRNRFTDAMLLSDIGVDFPDLKVIAAHMGQVNWRPWASLAHLQPNLYGDLAMWAPFAFGRFDFFCRELRDIIDYVGVSKVLFGTDDPIFSMVISTKDWVHLIRDLPKKASSGISFTEEEVSAILGGNAAEMLGLKQPAT
jgi:predicted TIM-barrel fold metal-dependent hydrolase